jgi:hypothetical protein
MGTNVTIMLRFDPRRFLHHVHQGNRIAWRLRSIQHRNIFATSGENRHRR